MAGCFNSLDPTRIARATSPALSDVSELTVLSRSPSPVLGYTEIFTRASEARKTSATVYSKHRGRDGRLTSCERKRVRSTSGERVTRKRQKLDTTSPTLEPTSPTPEVVGDGGFGTLKTLPKEIRQEIYSYAFNTNRPVTIKPCCGPDTTKRERHSCRKHYISTTIGTGRFNILQLSKAIRQEASWAVFHRGTLLLAVDKTKALYLKGYRPKTPRYTPTFDHHSKRKAAMWTAAAQYRRIKIVVPEDVLASGNPTVFTGHLVCIAALLCKAWEQQGVAPSTTMSGKSVHVNLGSLFHQMLPFNMESRAADQYGDLLDWLVSHSPCAEPDFDKLAAGCAHNLRRLVEVVGRRCGNSQWRFAARTQIDERDEGGATELRRFQVDCARNGVAFENID